MPYPVQNLIEGRSEPTTVYPSDSARQALSLMIEHDFTQLPVIDEGGHPLGMVTHGSILRALSNFGITLEELQVSNAMVKAQTYRPEEDLFDLLDRLKETNAVLIVDGEDKLIGIVTSYDSTEYFRRRSEDMMIVEDIETMVKDLVLAPFTDAAGEVDDEGVEQAIAQITSSGSTLLGQYRGALTYYLKLRGESSPKVDSDHLEQSFSRLAPEQPPKKFDELTLYEYTELLVHKSRWHLYQSFFDVESGAIRNLLSDLRETRNDLAHFRGDISARQRDQLRFCSEWLAQHPAEELLEQLHGIPASWPIPVKGLDSQPAIVQEEREIYTTTREAEDEVIPTEEDLGPSDSRYAPLAIWLQSRPSSQSRVQLSFEEVEEIIGGDLPPSARSHRSWWANDSVSHVQSQQWLDIGWRVAQINMTEGRVTFARIRAREAAYIDFFSSLLNDVREHTEFPLRDLWPDGSSWHTATSLPEDEAKSLHFVFAFSRGKHFRVELYIDTGDQEINKRIFDKLHAEWEQFQRELGTELAWERLSDKRASRIAWYQPQTSTITDSKETLRQVREWAAGAMHRFYHALAEPAVQALRVAQEQGNKSL